ncbi:ISNCY family transposase [Patescibacteria group bacterium]|nr:ISNCY family transposase [Patescibacteria group bacterium]
MSTKELKRAEIISEVISKKISQEEARKQLKLSYRHTNRLINKVRKHGIKALQHGNRGKESKRKITPEKEQKILDIYTQQYHDFKPTFACEKLEENHQIKISNEKLRQILIKNHLWSPRKHKNKQCHVWRERRSHPGELIQIDGSPHRWLEDRLDQEFCLMGFIDDATGKFFGSFYEYEGIFPVFDCFAEYISKYGLPRAVYLDRHSTYRTTRQPTVDEQLKNQYPLTQFESAMQELGVEVIHAYSPQAKGRVERTFETHQDRLVKELRLANISTIKDANEFIKTYYPKHNAKFAVQPKSNISFFRPLPNHIDLKWTLAIRDHRVIGNDYTIRWLNRLFLILNPYKTLRKQKVEIRQAINGDLRFTTKTKTLTVKEVTEQSILKAKAAQLEMIKIIQQKPNYAKSKKSWMDGFYIGKPEVVLVR